MEVYTGYSDHSSDSVNHRAKRMGAARGRSDSGLPSTHHHRPQKNAIRVCGDWSEQLSSKGKIYFYNCITEVSQWQKPPEWKLPDMDHDELLRLLGSREEDRNLKRPRVSTSTGVNNKDMGYDSRSSPKRSKFSIESRLKSQVTVRKSSPLAAAHFTTDVDRISTQRSRANVHSSPKRNHDRRAYATLPVRRQAPVNGPNRMHPVDDMDISPNSSPMSGCSGSSRSGQNNQSPHLSKCGRTDYGRVHVPRTVYDPSRGRTLEAYGTGDALSDKPGTLRNLVDAIRASIGGLLNQSPSSNSRITEHKPSVDSHMELISHPGYSTGRNDVPFTADNRYTSQVTRDRQNFDSHFRSPRPTVNDSPVPSSRSEEIRSCSRTDGSSHLSTEAPQDHQRRLNTQTKDMPGLVSTLTTLVSLIGGAKYQNVSTSHVHSSSSTPMLSTSQTPTQRTPTSYYPTPQHRFPTVSSVVPSPSISSIPPGASGSGGTCASSSTNTLARSLLNSNLPSHQVDHLLSSLEQFAQQTRHRSSKPPTIEYYQPSRSQVSSSEQYDPVVVHTDYSDRASDSPTVSNQNCSVTATHPKQLDTMFSCYTHPLENRTLLSSPSSSGRPRHPSDCFNETASLSTPVKTESVQDQQSQLEDFHSPLDAASSAIPGSSFCASTTVSTDPENSTIIRTNDPKSSSPDERPTEDECLNKITQILNSPTTQSFVDASYAAKFSDKAVERLEQEALVEGRKFEKLQSVLYGELSAESKKLRALVRISEAKLAIHREKQNSLQELMDAIETRKQLPNLSFSDDVI